MRILSVCLSVRLSVRQTRELWQNGRKICSDFYTVRKIIYPSFLRRRMVGGGDAFYLKFWVNRAALERNRRFWKIARSTSAVIPSEKSSINPNRKSTMRFPMSQDDHRTLLVQKKGAQRRKTAVLLLKSHFAWRKSATKFLCVKTVSSRVVGHSLA